jgi:hypothetical protein
MIGVQMHTEIVGEEFDPVLDFEVLAAEANMVAARAFVEREGVLMTAGPFSGRTYKSRTGEGDHVASRIGEPPHKDTGDLLDAITIDDSKNKGPHAEVAVGWDNDSKEKFATVAKALNDGLQRPHMDNAGETGEAARHEFLLASEGIGGYSQKLY